MAPEIQSAEAREIASAKIEQMLADPNLPLVVDGMTVAYRSKPVLWNIDFTAQQGRLGAIVGPNGAGKSTFLKAALGLIPSLSGSVKVFGEPIERQRHRIAYMPQRSEVDWDFPASAIDVVAMGLYRKIGWLRPVTRRHRDEAMSYLADVGLTDYANRQIGQLSGGQQQRVFLARSLAQRADLYCMDEPFAGVDAATEKAILGVLRKLKAEGKTVLVVHHDLETVRDYFDDVLLLNIRKLASGPVGTVFTEEALQRAYGGRLAATQMNAIAGQSAG